jgi:hypothetical protein
MGQNPPRGPSANWWMIPNIAPLIKGKLNTKRNEKRKCPLRLAKNVLFPIASYFEIPLYITKRAIYLVITR